MQDRFKFRAWDGNLMLYTDDSSFQSYKNELTMYKSSSDYVILSKNKNDIFMQCTGLKDMNGKLIYEGDVVKVKDNVDAFSPSLVGIVYWHNDRYRIMDNIDSELSITVDLASTDKFKKDGKSFYIYDFEIIGNLYENPELLKGDRK